MTHDQLVQSAIKAIENLFSDTSVPPETTKADMRALIEDIKMRIEALEDQMGYIRVS